MPLRPPVNTPLPIINHLSGTAGHLYRSMRSANNQPVRCPPWIMGSPGDAYIRKNIYARLNDYLAACYWVARSNRELTRMDRVDWADFGITLDHASPQFNWLVRMAVPIARWSKDYAGKYDDCFRIARPEYAARNIVAPVPNLSFFAISLMQKLANERLDMYIKSCWRAGLHNKQHPTSCRTVDPLEHLLIPMPKKTSRAYEGLLYSMQGIAEFVPQQYDFCSNELRALHMAEFETVERIPEKSEPRRFFVTGKIAPKPNEEPAPPEQAVPKKPKRNPYAHLFRDFGWESLTQRGTKICGLTPEQVNNFYRRMRK